MDWNEKNRVNIAVPSQLQLKTNNIFYEIIPLSFNSILCSINQLEQLDSKINKKIGIIQHKYTIFANKIKNLTCEKLQISNQWQSIKLHVMAIREAEIFENQ